MDKPLFEKKNTILQLKGVNTFQAVKYNIA